MLDDLRDKLWEVLDMGNLLHDTLCCSLVFTAGSAAGLLGAVLLHVDIDGLLYDGVCEVVR